MSPIRIIHNIPALLSYNAVNITQSSFAKSIRKLSTGLRINSAADDAAGLAISEKMRAQVSGLEQAERNAQDGVSMIQTAEGALQEVHSMLQRMRELSVQSANDTLTQQDRSYIQDEINQLRDEIDRIGNTTQFNKRKLLDGSAAALWSSSDLSTKAVVNGGLRVTDQFGQKSVNEGNYKISIEASPGRGEVLKTNSLVFGHETTVDETRIPPHDVEVPVIHPRHPQNIPIILDDFGMAVTHAEDMPEPYPMGANGILYFVDDLPYNVIVGDLEFYIKVDEEHYFSNNLTPKDAPRLTALDVKGWYTLDDGTSGVIDGIKFKEELFAKKAPAYPGVIATLTSGGKEVAQVHLEVYTDDYDVFWGGVQYTWSEENVNNPYTGPRSNYWRYNDEPVDISLMVGSTPYNLDADDVAGKLIQLNDVAGGTPYKLFNILDFRGVTADEIRGLVTDPEDPSFDEHAAPLTIGAKQVNISPDDYQYYNPIGDLAVFKNSEGRSLLADPQMITITQGDGKNTSFTLYASDTISSLVTKLNNAIGNGLEQAKYTDVGNKFAQFVSEAVPNTALSAFGTIVISSVLPGEDGRLYFSGDEDLMKALGLNVIQQAMESSFDIMVEDAHTGQLMARTHVTGNKMIGVVHENVDVTFDPMSDTKAVYNESSGYFELEKMGGVKTILHLADNTTVFQIGANEGEDMGIDIGDMRVHSLGLNRVLVVDREAAARSITIIDNAIDKISKQRARFGAYQNRLEHTVNNLAAAATNLTASESRIRDADMAKEMMNFAKLNIMLQSGSAMMTQANQLPQAVLSLLR